MDRETYSPLYSNSRALVIGINNYQHAPPLGYATNDAQAISNLLADECGFEKGSITFLAEADATKAHIMDLFLSYAKAEANERIIFFFAGHGHTVLGRRGEVGFLVPYDGDPHDLSTLIRWDEITKNADLIQAKHMLFVMDACYGGLILTRSLAPGSMRFLKDMLLRYSRQVLTAGKANEVVSDSGGPLAGHSIFTGHFIEALKGKAASEDGIITANGVMAYVYEKVAKDQNSHQTPHYGFVDGDGDMIFRAPILDQTTREEHKDEDVLVSIPSTMPMTNADESGSIVALTKEYLSDTRNTIKLDDLVTQKIREVLLLSSEDNFAGGTSWSTEEFIRRLKEYEQIVDDLLRISCCIAFWGTHDHLPVLRRALIRLTDRIEPRTGLTVWNELRWYPIMLLVFGTGISALAAEKFDNLATILHTKIGASRSSDSPSELVLAVGNAILELSRSRAFELMPGHERQYVPRSEYLFKLLQPMLDDLLFLGRDYENYFDRFEVLLALVFADLEKKYDKSHFWSPIGRFAWKFRNTDSNPLTELINEADREKDSWGPIKSGLFSGDYSRFKDVSSHLVSFLPELGWH